MKSKTKKAKQPARKKLASAKPSGKTRGAKRAVKGSDDYKLAKRGTETLADTGSDDYKL